MVSQGMFFQEIARSFPKDFLSQSPEDLESFGRDWTKVHPPAPCAIAFPRTTDEVSRILRLCTLHRIAVVPSGGRTGLAGGAVAAKGELVLSLSKMNRMDPVDELAQTVRVQAGAVTEAVHHHCEPHGLTWPVDFASKGSSHVGGNLSTNAGGVKVIRYGLARQWALGLQVVTMNGDVLELNGALEKNNTGVDLRQLFIGSEGTLGVITEATLKLTKLPGRLDVFFFALEDIPAVLRLFRATRKAPFQLMAFECLEDNCLKAVTSHRKIPPPFQQSAGAYVLLEVERPGAPDAQEVLDAWLAGLFESGLVKDGVLAQSPREARDLWSLREGIAEALYAKVSGSLHKNDIAVPIVELETFITDMYSAFAKRYPGLEIYLFGHIGDGNLHINILNTSGMPKDEFYAMCHRADEDLFSAVRAHRGSVSAEHGIGLLKKDALHYSRTPLELELFRQIKRALDPHGLLNPGKIFD